MSCIGDDASNEAVGIEAKVEVDVEGWGTQRAKNLLHLIRKLKFDK